MTNSQSSWILALAAFASIQSAAAASPYVPAALSDFQVQALFSPTNGYARAYGNCYDLLQHMRDLRGALWDTPEGKALLGLGAFENFWHVYETYIEMPCHLCETASGCQGYNDHCASMATSLDKDWQAVTPSAPWKTCLKAPALQATFTGWQAFTTCMSSGFPSLALRAIPFKVVSARK